MRMTPHLHRGFTLIELITTIILLGIVASALIPVLTNTLDIFDAGSARTTLVEKGRFAMQRMVREIRQAVPNSIEVINDAGGNPGLQFLKPKTMGRYSGNIAAASLALNGTHYLDAGSVHQLANGDVLLIGLTQPADIRPPNAVVTITVNDTNPADAYTDVDLTNNPTVASPGNHFFILDGSAAAGSVNEVQQIGLNNDAIYLHQSPNLNSYNDSVGDWSAADPLLVDGVTAFSVNYDSNSAIVTLELTLEERSESISLAQQIKIRGSM